MKKTICALALLASCNFGWTAGTPIPSGGGMAWAASSNLAWAVANSVGGATNGITATTASNTIAGMRPEWRTLRPSYYVDSVNGSDSNSGTNPAVPFLTIARLTNSAGYRMNDAVVHLARGSEWREELRIGSNCAVSGYGSGHRPILNAANVATNWVLSVGYSSTYYITNWTAVGGGSGSKFTVIENDRILRWTNSLAGVEATPGSFTMIVDPVAGSATNVIWVHPSFGGSPATNGARYEIPVRDYSLYAGDNTEVTGIHTKNQLINNGSMQVAHNAVVRDCVMQNGHKHNFLIGSGVVEDCLFYLAAPTDEGGSMAVAFDVNDGLEVVFRRCQFIGAVTPEGGQYVGGFYSHSSSTPGGYKLVALEDCLGANMLVFGGASPNPTNGVVSLVRCKSFATASFWSTSWGTNIIIDCEYTPNPTASGYTWQAGGNANLIQSAGSGSLFISGLRAACASTGAASQVTAIYAGSGAGGPVQVHNSTVFNAGAHSSSAFASINAALPLTISNCVSRGFGYGYYHKTNTITSGNNVWNNYQRFTLNSGLAEYTTLAALVAAYPTLEVSSTTNDVLFAGSPRWSDYGVSTNSPAIAIEAGFGFGLRLPEDDSRRAISSSGVARTTPPLVRPLAGTGSEDVTSAQLNTTSNQLRGVVLTNANHSGPKFFDLAEDYQALPPLLAMAADGVLFWTTNWPGYWPLPGDVTVSQLYAQGTSITNDVNTRTANLTNALKATQSGSFILTNLQAMGITNILAATGIALGTNGGVLWITNTGSAGSFDTNSTYAMSGNFGVTGNLGVGGTFTADTAFFNTLGTTNLNATNTMFYGSNTMAGQLSLPGLETVSVLATDANGNVTVSDMSLATANTLASFNTGTWQATNENLTGWQNFSTNVVSTTASNAALNVVRAELIASNSLYTPNLTIAKFTTNAAWAITLPIGGSVNAITNTLGGSTANLWLTNVVDGGYFVVRILADGTARTVSVTNASGLTLKVISTNGFSVLTLPQIPITASKVATICGRAWVIAGTTNVDLWANVEQ
jgi:hypothetical protein